MNQYFRELFAIEWFLATCALTALLFTVTGCGTAGGKAGSNYRTVISDPHRDVDRARQEDARGVVMLEGQDWSGAEEAFKKALAADVTYGPAHNNLGKVYFHQRKLYLAAWEFQYAIKLMPFRPEPKNNLGMVLEEAGKLDDAVRNYDEALAMEPENPELVGNAARARVRRGDRDSRTTELLSTIVMIDPRPSWSQWARERLILRGANVSAPATQSVTAPSVP